MEQPITPPPPHSPPPTRQTHLRSVITLRGQQGSAERRSKSSHSWKIKEKTLVSLDQTGGGGGGATGQSQQVWFTPWSVLQSITEIRALDTDVSLSPVSCPLFFVLVEKSSRASTPTNVSGVSDNESTTNVRGSSTNRDVDTVSGDKQSTRTSPVTADHSSWFLL